MSLYDGTGVSCCSASPFSCSRSSTAPSMSTSIDSVQCGIVAFDSAIRRAMICWIRDGSSTVTSPLPVCAFAGLALGLLLGLGGLLLGVGLGLGRLARLPLASD